MINTPLASFSFVLNGRPRPKERPRLGRRGRVFTPQKTRDYEHAMGLVARAAMPSGWCTTAEYGVTMTLYFKRGAVPDLDNCIKSIDGLNGIVWVDDRQVTIIRAMRLTDANERAEVTIERLTESKPAAKKRAPRKRKVPEHAADALMDVFGLERVKRRPKRAGKRRAPRRRGKA